MPWSAFRPVRFTRPNPDLSLMLGLGDVMPDQDYILVPRNARRARPVDPGPELALDRITDKAHPPVATECTGADLPRAVVFRDSFFVALIPLLSEHLSRALYIWHCPFDATIIERERPQLVIEEAVERRLWLDPPPPGVPDAMVARK